MSNDFGYDELLKKLNQIPNDFDIAATKLLNEMANELVAETQLRTPVKSGTLKRSWNSTGVQSSGNNKEVEVGSNVEYVESVEYGHRLKNGGFVKGRFMFKDALTKTSKVFYKRANDLMKEVVND